MKIMGKKCFLFFFVCLFFKWLQAGKEKGAWFEILEESEPEGSHYFLLFLVE